MEYAAQRLGYDREEMSGVFYFKSDLNSLDIKSSSSAGVGILKNIFIRKEVLIEIK